MWHSLVKKVVKLQINHQFNNGHKFSNFLDKYRKNTWSEEDVKTINSRMIDERIGMVPPKNDNIDTFVHAQHIKDRIVLQSHFFKAY